MTYSSTRSNRDLSGAAGPFDRSMGTLRVNQAPMTLPPGSRLTVENYVEDLEWQRARNSAAHLHTGPCVDEDYDIPLASDGQSARTLAQTPAGKLGRITTTRGPQQVHPTPDPVNAQNEVWFDAGSKRTGEATADTKVLVYGLVDDSRRDVNCHSCRNPQIR